MRECEEVSSLGIVFRKSNCCAVNLDTRTPCELKLNELSLPERDMRRGCLLTREISCLFQTK